MEAARALYDLHPMQEPGISKLVTVKFDPLAPEYLRRNLQC